MLEEEGLEAFSGSKCRRCSYYGMSRNVNSSQHMYPNDADPQGGGQPLFEWSSHYWKHSENACLSGNCLPADGTFFRIVLMMVNLSLLNLNFGPYVAGNFLGIPTQGNTQRIKQWHKPITAQLRPTSCFAGVRTYLTLSPGVGLWSGRSSGVARGKWTLIVFCFVLFLHEWACIVHLFSFLTLQLLGCSKDTGANSCR